MYPYLFNIDIGGLTLRPPTYGVMLALAFSVAYFESLRRASKLGEETRHIENLFLICVGASVVGARMFHVLFEEPNYYFKNPAKIFAVWEGGYTFHGALIMAMACMSAYCYFNKIKILQFLDIATPPTMIGLALGRLGCFFAGCCWGLPTDQPWGVRFDHPDTFSMLKTMKVHPTQLYSAGGAFLLFLMCLWIFKRRRFPGQVLFSCMIGYGFLRFIVEFFRGDEYRGFAIGGNLSYAQIVSVVLVATGTTGLVYFFQKLKKT